MKYPSHRGKIQLQKQEQQRGNCCSAATDHWHRCYGLLWLVARNVLFDKEGLPLTTTDARTSVVVVVVDGVG